MQFWYIYFCFNNSLFHPYDKIKRKKIVQLLTTYRDSSSILLFLMHYFHRMTGNIKAERFTDSTTIILCRPLVGQILYIASWTMNKTFQNQTKMSFYISKLRTKTQKCLLLHYDLESSPSKFMVICFFLLFLCFITVCFVKVGKCSINIFEKRKERE